MDGPEIAGGLKFTAGTMNMEQSQSVQARTFQVEDVARWFRMPVHLILGWARDKNLVLQPPVMEKP